MADTVSLGLANSKKHSMSCRLLSPDQSHTPSYTHCKKWRYHRLVWRCRWSSCWSMESNGTMVTSCSSSLDSWWVNTSMFIYTSKANHAHKWKTLAAAQQRYTNQNKDQFESTCGCRSSGSHSRACSLSTHTVLGIKVAKLMQSSPKMLQSPQDFMCQVFWKHCRHQY